ncbi:MAG TPA: hypothetical protein VG204_13555 [Terriglobia bacterium]|nr:hypothetical protein [Terriglobia bacterium]
MSGTGRNMKAVERPQPVLSAFHSEQGLACQDRDGLAERVLVARQFGGRLKRRGAGAESSCATLGGDEFAERHRSGRRRVSASARDDRFFAFHVHG